MRRRRYLRKHLEIFEKVTVRYDYDAGMLYVDDYDKDEQLAVFKVVEE